MYMPARSQLDVYGRLSQGIF